jgi:hypothetical protein
LLHRTLPQLIGLVVVAAVCGGALWRGGRDERMTAIALILATAASPLFQHRNWVDPQYGVLVVDLMLLAFLFGLALRSDRYWPLPAAAFQLLGVITHVAIVVDHGVRAWAYLTGLVIWSYLVFAALAVGVWMYRRDLDEAGFDDA